MSKKRPKRSKNISISDGKNPRAGEDVSSADNLSVVWKLSKIDWDGPWGLKACDGICFINFIQEKIRSFESMTWAEIYRASGGRSSGNNHHPIDVSKLSKAAKDRLVEINQHDVTEIVSFRLDGTTRLYGIRDSRAFEILWYDPWHGDSSVAVCPAKKRRT